jgi:hypothetical protein
MELPAKPPPSPGRSSFCISSPQCSGVPGCAIAALLTRACVGVASLALAPDVFHIALIRTIILCLAVLTMAFGGARLDRLLG